MEENITYEEIEAIARLWGVSGNYETDGDVKFEYREYSGTKSKAVSMAKRDGLVSLFSTLPILNLVKNRGHVWFGGLQDYILNHSKPDFYATDETWNFFKNI